MPISKSDFIRALQCEKMLWLDSHKPEEKIIPPNIQARLEQGNAFGDIAMGIFGEFKETTCFKPDGRLDYAQMIKTTALLLAKQTPVICEGAFSWLGNFCATDILKKDGDFYSLYEVKDSAFIKKEFLLDLAFQRMLLKKCNVKISDAFLVLNGEKYEQENEKQGGQGCVERKIRIQKDGCVFDIFCVSEQVYPLEKIVERNLFPFGKIKRKDAPMPQKQMGEHCYSPYPCWYLHYCEKVCVQENIQNNLQKNE